MKNPIILTFPQICTCLSPKFGGNPEFDDNSLCVYYWHCIVESLLFFSKVTEEKPLGGSTPYDR